LSYERPERINNTAFNVNAGSGHDFERLFGQLDDLGCKALELRLF